MSSQSEIYQSLSEPFDITFTDVRGGVSLTYITGEQVVTRLNDVLGPFGWSFRIVEHGINQEADEAWALGELVATVDGITVMRQQFGSQKMKRSRASGVPLDIGFDLKGAATDAMKKCASLIGVGLYLSRKKAPQAPRQAPQQQTQRPRPVPSLSETKAAEDKHLATARVEWDKTVELAIKAGITTSAISDDVTVEKLERWTGALQQRIEEVKASQANEQSAA